MADQALEQIGWEWRWKDLHPDTVTSGQWSAWERVKPRGLQTEGDAVRELRAYIANGLSYQVRPIYAGPAVGYGVEASPAPRTPDPVAAAEEAFYALAEKRGWDTTADPDGGQDFADETTQEHWQAWLSGIEFAHGVTGVDGQSNSRESPMPTPDEQ